MNTTEPWMEKKYNKYNIGDNIRVKQFNYMLFKATKPATIVDIDTTSGNSTNNAYRYDVLYDGEDQVHSIRADEIEGSSVCNTSVN